MCIYEQFDEAGPVGSGLMLQPTGLDVLNRWGLRERAEHLGQRIDGMLGRIAPEGKVVLDIQYKALHKKQREPLYGVAIHRASLFHVLHEAVVERGITIVTSANIVDVSNTSSNTVQVIDETGKRHTEEFDFIVDASGAHSNLANSYGRSKQPTPLAYGALWTTVELDEQNFDKTLLEQRYDAARIMVGVLPCGRLPDDDKSLATLFWSIRADQLAVFKADGLQAWKQAVVQQWPTVSSLLNKINSIEQLTHATYVHHTMRKPFARNIIFIGDAAHATSPQLGQGANMALLDALALAQAIIIDDRFDKFAALYARMRGRHVKLFQTASWLLTPFYQSDNRALPLIRDTLFEPVTKLPFAASMVASLGSGLLTNPAATIDRVGSDASRTSDT